MIWSAKLVPIVNRCQLVANSGPNRVHKWTALTQTVYKNNNFLRDIRHISVHIERHSHTSQDKWHYSHYTSGLSLTQRSFYTISWRLGQSGGLSFVAELTHSCEDLQHKRQAGIWLTIMTEESYHIRLVTLGGASVGKSAIIKVCMALFRCLWFYDLMDCNRSTLI